MGSKNNKNSRMRLASQLIRREARKPLHESIHIICEGETECAYLRRLVQDIRLPAVTVCLGKGSAPISIVEQAIKLAKDDAEIDHIFCVFDKDDHESYERANHVLINYQLQNRDKPIPNLKIFASVPCFEIWLFLHFGYSTKSYVSKTQKSAADCVLSDLQKHFPQYRKGTNIDWYGHLTNKRNIALENAKRLQKHNDQTQSNNPATNMHELVEFLINKSSLSLL